MEIKMSPHQLETQRKQLEMNKMAAKILLEKIRVSLIRTQVSSVIFTDSSSHQHASMCYTARTST